MNYVKELIVNCLPLMAQPVALVRRCLLGIATGAVMTKRINAREKSMSVEVQKKLRKFTIVEQANQAALYR